VFSTIIAELTSLRKLSKPASFSTLVTDKVVRGIETTTSYVTSGITITTDVISCGIKKTGEAIKNKINLQENVSIPGPIKKGVELTEKIVMTTSAVTGAIVGVIVDGISYVAAGTLIAVHDSMPKSTSDERFENVKKVCVQGVKSFAGIVGTTTEGV